MVNDKIVNAVVRIAIVVFAAAVIVEVSLFALGGTRAVQNGVVVYIKNYVYLMSHEEPKPAPAPAAAPAPEPEPEPRSITDPASR